MIKWIHRKPDQAFPKDQIFGASESSKDNHRYMGSARFVKWECFDERLGEDEFSFLDEPNDLPWGMKWFEDYDYYFVLNAPNEAGCIKWTEFKEDSNYKDFEWHYTLLYDDKDRNPDDLFGNYKMVACYTELEEEDQRSFSCECGTRDTYDFPYLRNNYTHFCIVNKTPQPEKTNV